MVELYIKQQLERPLEAEATHSKRRWLPRYVGATCGIFIMLQVSDA